MRIRVVRLLEYSYDSVDTMVADQQRWAIPANGVGPHPNKHVQIRSAVLPVDLFDVELTDDDDWRDTVESNDQGPG